MDSQGITLGYSTLIGIGGGLIGGVGSWYALKNKLSLMNEKVKFLEKECAKKSEDIEKINELIKPIPITVEKVSALEKEDLEVHEKMNSMSKQIESNREKSDNSVTQLTSAINSMEIRIITAIHEIGNKK